MEKVKYSIIGAGVIGLAIAEPLSRKKDGDIVVFEKNEKFGQETSSRNSEVIHAGIYYPKDSLKSKLCLKGNKMLYEFCKVNNIPHKRCGKLIVSTNEEEVGQIESIYANAVSVGVPGIRQLSKDEIKKLEPGVFALNGIYSETTGIVDSHALMNCLYQKAQMKGIMFAFGNEVRGIERANKAKEGYIIKTISGEEIMSQIVINCAGLNSDKVAEVVGFDIDALGYKLHYCKGDYFSVKGSKGRLKHLVYPVPQKEGYGLGMHATLDLEGYFRLGPDDEYVEEINYDIDVKKRGEFYRSAKAFLPWLGEESLMADTSGIRPKLQGPKDSFRDFVIKEESDNGFSGFVNLIGIESPGLTASLGIGEYVAAVLNGFD